MVCYLRFLIVCFVCFVIPAVGAIEYDRLLMAVPRSVFEQHYTIETSTQTLKAGSRYKYLGKVAEFYFINHIFEDESTHLVRVPIKNGDQVLLKHEDNEVVVLSTFKLDFEQASVLFYPSKEYRVVEEKGDALVVQVDDIERQLEVPKARFTLRRSLVARPKVDASSANAFDASVTLELPEGDADAIIPLKNAVDGICVIKTSTGSGTGFLFAMNYRVYCITNHHVLSSAQALEISTADGRKFTPIQYEVAEDRDLARILLKETPACFEALATAELNESVRILGNSGGAGVVTFDQGKVIGHGPDEIEVDADFIKGNSGSPVLNEADEVIGVATYVTSADKGKDNWVTEKTRFAKARRFAVRLTDSIVWVPVDENRLKQGERIVKNHTEFIQQSVDVVLKLAASPTEQMAYSNISNSSLRSWVLKMNAINLKLMNATEGLPYRSAQAEQLKIEWINSVALQIRSLTHLTKRQLVRLHQDERTLLKVGYFTKQIKDLDAQYTFLITGLTDLATRVSKSSR